MPLLKIILRNTCACLVMVGATQASFAEVLPGMKDLQNNTIANANDLNQNFEVLSDQALTNEERIKRLEDTSTRLFRENQNPALVFSRQGRLLDDGLVELTGGRLELNVDCGADPWALVDAYQSYGRYKELVFTLSGEACYGSFFYNRAYTEAFREPFQAITLKSANLQSPTAITPRPNNPDIANVTHDQIIGLGAKDGSSLTINNVKLLLGNCDMYGVFAERNANLKLHGVTIKEFTGQAPACPWFPGIPRYAGISADYGSLVEITQTADGSGSEQSIIDLTNTLSGIAAKHSSIVYVGQDLVVSVTLSAASTPLMALRLEESLIHTVAGEITLISPTDSTTPSHALRAWNSDIEFESWGPVKATGNVLVEGGSFTAVEGFAFTHPNDDMFSVQSAIVVLAGYDPAELPPGRISCAGPHTLDFNGIRQDGTYGYLYYTDPALTDLDDHCVSKQGWDTLLQQAH